MRAPAKYLMIVTILAFFALATCSKLNVNQNPPEVPSAPSPADGGTLDSLAIELSWTCSDPDGDPLTYDIYLDTSATPEVLVATVDTTSYTPVGLHYNLTYYWKIVATDTTGLATEGPVWSFSFGADMIAPSCSLIAPNGGELWYIGTDYDITWQTSDDDSITHIVLEYSIDGGDSWVAIGDTIGGGNQDTSWTIPPEPSLQCLVRISCTDLGGNAVSDTSDAVFTIWPQGGMIAFSSNRGGDHDIYTMYADGTTSQNITDSLERDYLAKWSPDGSKIVFHTYRHGPREIYTMNYDGTAQTNISQRPADEDVHPAWSPSGDKIAYSTNRRNGVDYDLWTMNVDGSGKTAITTNDFHEYGADWSPNGEQIVHHNLQYGNWEIVTYIIDSDSLIRLTDTTAYDAYPAWSPDGQLIAFCSDRDGDREIYTMNANGSNPRRITDNPANDNFPAWSPDGSRIIFQSNRTGDWELWIIDPDNPSDPQNFSNDLGDDQYPSWSPIY
ncbi:MAG: PD40 domain-containing protein [Candidatus Zixiibacteriota bacterium]|nr:MAG: PD40 domain-containing protein [candidate division Zixibacteria bacterium]